VAYLGTQPVIGQYRKLDNISGSFNGSATTFNLTVSTAPVTAGTAQQLLISLGGVIQNPGTDYTVSTNTITFTTAPAVGLSFFGVLMGDTLNTGTPSDGTVGTSKLVDGSVTPSKLSQPLTLSTSVASTSGTSIDFTGIPSWVKRITVMFFDVSTSGSDYLLVRLGTSGGIESDAAYFSMTGANTTASVASAVNYTTGFGIQSGNASNSLQGQYIFTNISGNDWIATGNFTGNTSSVIFAAGRRTLGSVLTRLRITTTGGTDTFDAGSINILYEG
jgi:hypothetical protein